MHLVNLVAAIIGVLLVVAAIPEAFLAGVPEVSKPLLRNSYFTEDLEHWTFNYRGRGLSFIVMPVQVDGKPALKVSSTKEAVGEVVMSQRFMYNTSWTLLSPMFVKTVLRLQHVINGGAIRVVIKAPHGAELKSEVIQAPNEHGVYEIELEDALWPYTMRYLTVEIHFIDENEEVACEWLMYEASITLIDKRGVAVLASFIVIVSVIVVGIITYLRTRV